MDFKQYKKISIIGTGFVGSTTAYTLMLSGLTSEIVLVDVNKTKAEGEALDLNHGMPFVSPVKIYSGDYSDTVKSHIIIITAGASQQKGETRLDLVHKNTKIFNDIIKNIIKYNNDCILLVVTNPVDILSYVTYKVSGFNSHNVIGSGTVLDTARFKYLLGQYLKIDSRNLHAFVVGEHGDSEVLIWSLANVAGLNIDKYCINNYCSSNLTRDTMYNMVSSAAYEIIEKKGATYFAVALCVRRIVEAIIRNEYSVLTVSTLLKGEFGLSDVYLSLPSIVYKNGIEKILNIEISNNEKNLLKESGKKLKNIIDTLDI